MLASLLALAAPAVASLPGRPVAPQAPAQGSPAPPDVRALLAAALPLAQSEQCPALLALLDPALPRLTGKDREVVQLLRIPCLGQVGRGAEIAGVYRELAAAEPGSPAVRSVGVFVAASGGDYKEAGTRLAALAEDHPESLNAITSTLARGIAQQLTQARDLALRDRLFLALARADWQPQDKPEMRDSLAQGAIEALLDARQVDEASTLLPRVTMPELLVSMALERRYEPLWPAIEARLGAHSEKAVAPFAAARLEEYTRNPDDERAQGDAVRAFLLLGRYPEAAEVATRVMIADGMSDEAISVVRYHAQALRAQGDTAGAIARMMPFATLDLARTPQAVTGLVGLAELLDEAGREQEALSVARTTLAKGGAALSPWGAGWLRRTEACAERALGEAAPAKAAGDMLAAHSADNEAASIEGLLCLGRIDEAARIAVAAFGTAEGAGNLADQFQPEGAFWAPAPSRLRLLWAPLLARPEVKAAFEKRARILPRPLWPAREPRPIPRPEGAPTGAGVT